MEGVDNRVIVVYYSQDSHIYMNAAIRHTRRFAQTTLFLASTVLIFVFALSAAESVGFVPCYIDGTEPCGASTMQFDTIALSDLPQLGEEILLPSEIAAQSEAVQTTAPTAAVSVTNPKRIVIPTIAMDLPVHNPSTRDLEKLDEELKDGPVRFVDSARLGEKGNVLIFAHTSHLPVVHNQMYKAFNRISELQPGNVITIIGEDGKSYLYSVTSVRKANADAVIDLSKNGNARLTLVTCDTLTSKNARFIAEADFVGVVESN